MTKPVAEVVSEPQSRLPDPIAEVHVLVYGWERGKTEVRVKFPAEAISGKPGAAARQDQFRNLVLAELDESIRVLSR